MAIGHIQQKRIGNFATWWRNSQLTLAGSTLTGSIRWISIHDDSGTELDKEKEEGEEEEEEDEDENSEDSEDD